VLDAGGHPRRSGFRGPALLAVPPGSP